MEAAFKVDPSHEVLRKHLLEWNPEVWSPRLDQAAADRANARAKAEILKQKHLAADELGRGLAAHAARQAQLATLGRWYRLWSLRFAATTIARTARGYLGRRRAKARAADVLVLRASTARVCGKINGHLLRDCLRGWCRHWRRAAAERVALAAPSLARFQRALKAATVAAWHLRARRQRLGKAAALKAMRGLKRIAAPGRFPRKTAAAVPHYYSAALVALASYPTFRRHHEECVARIVEEKRRMEEIMREAGLGAETPREVAATASASAAASAADSAAASAAAATDSVAVATEQAGMARPTTGAISSEAPPGLPHDQKRRKKKTLHNSAKVEPELDVSARKTSGTTKGRLPSPARK
jgi:hypothetical protein